MTETINAIGILLRVIECPRTVFTEAQPGAVDVIRDETRLKAAAKIDQLIDHWL